MTIVNPSPHNLLPEKWAYDDEVGPFVRELLDNLMQLRERTGGSIDLIDENQQGQSSLRYSSIAAASADSHTDRDTVTTISYYNGLKKGAAVYYRDGTTGVASTIYSDNSGFYDVNGEGFRLPVNQSLNVFQFGARGDGSTDDLLPFQYAVDFVGSRTIYIPRGTFIVSDEVTISKSGRTLEGEGRLVTTITSTNTTANILNFEGSAKLQACGVRKLTISQASTAEKTAGAHIRAKECEDFRVEDCDIRNWWIGIRITGGKNNVVNLVNLFNGARTVSGKHGVMVEYDSAAASLTGISTSIYLQQVDIESRNTAGFVTAENGFYFNSSDSIYMDQCHCFTAENGLTVEAGTTTGDFFIGLWVANSYFDKCTERNINFLGSATSYEDIIFTGCEFRAPDINCVFFGHTSTIRNITFNGCQFRKSGTYLVVCNPSTGAVENITISNSLFQLGNQDAAANISDAFIKADGIVFTGNAHIDGTAGTGKCITLASGADNILVHGNLFAKSVNATTVNDLSGAVTKLITDNL